MSKEYTVILRNPLSNNHQILVVNADEYAIFDGLISFYEVTGEKDVYDWPRKKLVANIDRGTWIGIFEE